uniref:GTD-binding domain-containing protein n=1 Tax=Davidia involucrata TaxID=16924 RepID=A0A5B6ZUF2_DAVIN
MVGMVAKETSPVPLQRNRRGFMNLLSSAACEWFLIFLLFVDAALSYLLTKFACYCELQTPCLLCSRLDHVFGNEKPWSLLCSNHRVEISSLISCHIHGKLADARGMCEECLMSFDKHNKSNSEAYRLLVGKFGVDFEQCGFQSPFSNKNHIPGSLTTRTCSCCNKSWRARSNVQRLLQLTPIGFGATKPNVKPPLPRLSGRSRLSRRDSLKRMRDKFSGPRPLGNNGIDSLSHVGYTELKINSDSESEVPFSDDDDGSSVAREKVDPNEELLVLRGSEILPKTQTDDLAPVKQAQQVSNPAASLLDQCMQLDVSESHDVKCLESDVVIEHGLGELNWQQVSLNPNPSALPELISLDAVPPSPNVVEVPFGASANKPDVPLSHNSSLLALSELIPLDGIPSSSDVVEEALGASPEKSVDVTGTSDIGHTSVSKHAEFSELTNTKSGTGCKNDQLSYDTTPSMPSDMDLSDAYKLAIRNRGREVSGMHADKLALSDPEKVPENSKPLPHILSAHRIDTSLNNTSPKAYGHHGELESTSSSNGIRALQKSAFLGDSGYESQDGSSVSEIEGESVVDRLKRQIDYDRTCMSSLYKELDEERNASAVAVNEAMAMITRLQEEKAALNMEALQYLRMMEEQAEYDMEALEKANDLLAEREKELQDLETELEFYRNNFPDESMVLHEETYNLKGENMMVENNGGPCIEHNAFVPCNSMSAKISEGSKKSIDVKTSLLDFEDERIYISQCLKKLERKLHQVSSKEAPADMPNGGYSEKVADGVNNQEEFVTRGGTRIDHQKEENCLSMRKDLSELNGSPAQEGCVASVEDNHFVSKENNHFDSDQQKLSMNGGKNYFVALENEISDLNDRLESLEADRGFLEHVFNTLQNGNEGLRFIQEIVHQLQELRKIGIKERCLSVP